MKRVLIVAYYFPPAGGIGSLRLSAFARYLPEYGWEPIILAPRNPSYHHDPELRVDEQHVIRTGSIELSRAGKRVLRTGGDDTSAAHVSGFRRRLRDAARDVLYFPDGQIGWYPPAARAARLALGDMPPDAIFSSSFPVTAHLVARRIHRRTGAPWVAEFRDPWSQTLREGSVKRRRAAALERRLMSEATVAATVSPSWARMFEGAWRRPVEVLPNGHDATVDSNGRTAASSDELVVGYLGTYYPQLQDLNGVWKALATLSTPVRIRLIGAENATLREQLARAGLAERLEVTGFLSQQEATRELQGCSLLVLAGPTRSDALSRGHVVAKTWEYLASQLPILYVGDRSSDVAELLNAQPGCALHEPGDVPEITRSLEVLPHQRFERAVESHTRRARTAELARWLDGLGSSNPERGDGPGMA
jgi:glycosyltransferase involved in cell wall biosynthesis